MITSAMLKWLRVIALSEAQDRPYSAWYDSICRWYSREFHTPLQEVEDMADVKVISTYFKDSYWKLSSGTEEQQNRFAEMVMDVLKEEHPEYKQLAEQTAQEDDDWYEREIAEFEKKLKKKQATEKSKKNKKDPSHASPLTNPNLSDIPETTMVTVNEPIPDDEGL